MPNRDLYAIELDTRDKHGGVIIRQAQFSSEKEAMKAWHALKPDPDPDVQYWLVRIRSGIDDPAHCDALDIKFTDQTH
jgi:hypothetical protein